MANDIEAVARDIVDAAFKVHKEFGPGITRNPLISNAMPTNCESVVEEY